MKTILFADGDVGKSIAHYLLESYLCDISMIVTMEENSISELAKQYEVKTRIFEKTESLVDNIDINIDLGILAWWPKIIKSPLLEKPRLGFINTHPSLLPFNRGKHYNFWALVEQVPFGVTIHRVDSSVDTGEIVAQKDIPYDWTDDGESLYKKAQSSMINLFQSTYPKLRSGNIESIAQSEEIGSFHHSSELELASEVKLDNPYKARDLINLLRARTFTGHPGCWFIDGSDKYEISISIRKVKL
jgi:methionyl-tRNA formyltransferase